MMDDKTFAAYLMQLASDYDETGQEFLVKDLAEAARRIREIEYREEAAYEAGMQDAIARARG